MCRSSWPTASKAPGRCTGKTSTPTVASGCSAFWWSKAKSPTPGRALGRTTSRSCWMTMTSESSFPAHAGWRSAPGLDSSGPRGQWRQFVTAVATHDRLRADQLRAKRAFPRFALPHRLALESLLIRFDHQCSDDADEWTQKQAQQKEADSTAAFGAGNDGAQESKGHIADKNFHALTSHTVTKVRRAAAVMGPPTLADVDQTPPGGHSRRYPPEV